MKSTGIVRRYDSLGRIVVPIEIRKAQGWSEGTAMEIYTEGDKLILKKYAPGCTFCGSIQEEMMPFGGKLICKGCAGTIRDALGKGEFMVGKSGS